MWGRIFCPVFRMSGSKGRVSPPATDSFRQLVRREGGRGRRPLAVHFCFVTIRAFICRWASVAVVRSKICGITRVEDALVAAEAGADAIGLVFYPRSPRAVTVEQARRITRALPPFVSVAGLFVDASRCEIGEILDAVPLDVLQFHGDEPPEACHGFHRPWYKALRVRPGEDVQGHVERYAGASAVLLDTFVAGVPGGTGETFDWSLVPPLLSKPLILAGGLTAENVQRAIGQTHPFAVDVSGGVEQEKGIKDARKVREFVTRVRACM